MGLHKESYAVFWIGYPHKIPVLILSDYKTNVHSGALDFLCKANTDRAAEAPRLGAARSVSIYGFLLLGK
jgi:hypothetical protein